MLRVAVITALIVVHNYDVVVLFAQGRVILWLFAVPCKHSSIEARGSGGAEANVNRKSQLQIYLERLS